MPPETAEPITQSTGWADAARAAAECCREICPGCEAAREREAALRNQLQVSRNVHVAVEEIMATLPRSAVDFTGCSTAAEKLARWREATLRLLDERCDKRDLEAAVQRVEEGTRELRRELTRKQVSADNVVALECERWRVRALAAEARLGEVG